MRIPSDDDAREKVGRDGIPRVGIHREVRLKKATNSEVEALGDSFMERIRAKRRSTQAAPKLSNKKNASERQEVLVEEEWPRHARGLVDPANPTPVVDGQRGKWAGANARRAAHEPGRGGVRGGV